MVSDLQAIKANPAKPWRPLWRDLPASGPSLRLLASFVLKGDDNVPLRGR